MSLSADLIIGLRIAFRARFLAVSLWLLLVTLSAAWLAALFSARQPATVALDVGLSAIRIAVPLMVVLLVQELLCREFERKIFLNSITYPRPRHHFLLGRVIAILVLLLALLAVLATAVVALVAWIASGYHQAMHPALDGRLLLVLSFVALDFLIVLAIGTLLGVLARTSSFVLLGTLGLMLVARSYSSIVELLTRDNTLVGDADIYQSSLSLLGYLIPDLAALDVRMVSLYGQVQFLPDDWPLRVISTLAYAAALFALAVWTLNRKKFA